MLRPFLDETAVAALYRAGSNALKVGAAIRALAGRLRDVLEARHGFDGVLVHREAALIGPPIVERLLGDRFNLPIIFDLDDALWVEYTSPTYGATLSRWLKYPQKADEILAKASHVMAGSPYVADHARALNPRVSIVPTVVDTDVFTPVHPANPVPVLGWIGTHSTVPYLQSLVPALTRLAHTHRFVLRVVGGRITAPGINVDHRTWALAREVEDFQGLDVGLYPLVQDAWSAGKSGFKAIQYMACGLPVVASPVGVTQDIVQHGQNGFLATSDDDWVDTLKHLLDDPSARNRIGQAARADACALYSRKAYEPRVVQIVLGALQRR